MLYEAIKYLFPDILDSQFFLQNDGSGPYIKTWAYAQPKPSQTQIDAAIQAVTAQVSVPTVINMRQARLALLQSGYLDQVDALMAALPGTDGKAARVDWQFAATVERTHPLVAAMASALPLTSAQLDTLFTLGASL